MEKAKVLLEKGKQLLQEGDWPRASEAFREALDGLEEKASTKEEKTLLSRILVRKAYADARMTELHLARTELEDALEISKALNDISGIADALRGIGYVFILEGEVDHAMENYKKALAQAERTDDKDLIGRIRLELGNIYYYVYDFDKAKEEYGRALSILKAVGNQSELARVYNNLGDIHKYTGDLEEAIEYHRRCMELSKKIGNKTAEGFSALNAAECFLLMKELRFAREYLAIATTTLKSTNDKIGQAYALRVHGLAHMAEKQYDAAERSLLKSIAIAKAHELGNVEAEALRTLADVFIARGEKEAAKDALRRTIELFDRTKRTRESEEAKQLLQKIG